MDNITFSEILKKKNIIIAFIAVFALFAACAGCDSDNKDSKQEKTLTAADVKVHGPLKDYFEVVDKSYKFVGYNVSRKINVEFKRLAGVFPLEEGEDFAKNSNDSGLKITMEIEYLDEDGNVLDKSTCFDDLVKLAKFDEGDTGSLEFRYSGDETPAKFRITSSMEHIKAKENTTTSSETSTTTSSDDDAEDAMKTAKQAVDVLGDMVDVFEKASKMK